MRARTRGIGTRSNDAVVIQHHNAADFLQRNFCVGRGINLLIVFHFLADRGCIPVIHAIGSAGGIQAKHSRFQVGYVVQPHTARYFVALRSRIGVQSVRFRVRAFGSDHIRFRRRYVFVNGSRTLGFIVQYEKRSRLRLRVVGAQEIIFGVIRRFFGKAVLRNRRRLAVGTDFFFRAGSNHKTIPHVVYAHPHHRAHHGGRSCVQAVRNYSVRVFIRKVVNAVHRNGRAVLAFDRAVVFGIIEHPARFTVVIEHAQRVLRQTVRIIQGDFAVCHLVIELRSLRILGGTRVQRCDAEPVQRKLHVSVGVHRT